MPAGVDAEESLVAIHIHPLACAPRTPLAACQGWGGGTLPAARGFLPLIFGESTVISDELLDARGRRLMRRLEEAGWASVARSEMRDAEGVPHITFSYHLRPKPAREDHPIVQRAIDELSAIYDQLPEVAWKHPNT